ncbi:MAG: succinate dehydrogenase/fumarate reductase cytochrome b subunit [Chloroflexi bacterium]|nr:succinate dehydrogenase/fumarate reductase cytochrome b subunit [Chloroflexota bacterium]
MSIHGRRLPQPGASRGAVPRSDGATAEWSVRTEPWPALTQPRRAVAVLELALSLTGVGLAVFMVMHMGLLFSVLIGTTAMDTLAGFLERYYLLQIGVVFLLLFLLGHIFLSVRKVPASFRQQSTLLRHIRSTRHLDTWTWAFQIVSGVALLGLVAIHLWVILTDLPVQATKSGARVFQIYLWLYIPFILIVESHMSIGIYRMAVKWGILSRRLAHPILLVWTALVLALGFAILVTLYRVGGRL